jgi:hypothetical protein
MRFVKLNAFQRIMRMWDAVHPYNAVQAFRLEGDADVSRIDAAWQSTLRASQLGRVVANGTTYAHVAPDSADRSTTVQVVPDAKPLHEFLSDEMNFRFGGDDRCPFRAFVRQESDASHVIGVTYHHWVADSVSIRWLLREWSRKLLDPAYESARPARIAENGLLHTFGPDVCKWRYDEAILAMLRYRTRFSRARLVGGPVDHCTVQLSLHQLPEGCIEGLVHRAAEHRVTVNDLLLSMIASVVDQHGANPRTSGRDELAVGTVVDLRSLSGVHTADPFGLFLGFTTTMLRPAHLRDFSRLMRTVARQNAWHKRTCAAQSSVLRMGVGLAEGALMSPHEWAAAYRRRMPIAAGISNVNMNRTWAGEHHPSPIRDYYRVAPTGPMIPLLFTFTTLGTKLNFFITRQTAVVDERRNSIISNAIIDGLCALSANKSGTVNITAERINPAKSVDK